MQVNHILTQPAASSRAGEMRLQVYIELVFLSSILSSLPAEKNKEVMRYVKKIRAHFITYEGFKIVYYLYGAWIIQIFSFTGFTVFGGFLYLYSYDLAFLLIIKTVSIISWAVSIETR